MVTHAHCCISKVIEVHVHNDHATGGCWHGCKKPYVSAADGKPALGESVSGALAAASGAPAVPGYARPVKSLLNLTTVVDSLAFSPDEQVNALMCLGFGHIPALLPLLAVDHCCSLTWAAHEEASQRWSTHSSAQGFGQSSAVSLRGGM